MFTTRPGRSGLLAMSASAAVLAALSTPALAQAPADDGFQIEELVITAEKREQSLQDVSVAVSAYTSGQRDVMGVAGIQDFVNFTPGMNYSGADRISLRGAGRNTFLIGNDPAVATYSDGFYSSSSSELFKSSLFVERTEILRGPQGTLYGRNSLGGAVNTISKRPSRDFSGEIRGAVGNYELTRAEGVVSLPVAEHLRFKIGGGQEWQRKGFIANQGPANRGAAFKRTYFEVQAEAELGDNAAAWLRYSRSNWDDSMGVGDRLANLVSPYETTRAVSPLGTMGLVTNPGLGYGVANPGVTNPYLQNTNRNGYGNLRGNHLLTGQATWDLGWAELKYIGGFQMYDYQTGGDYDATSRTAPLTVAGVPGVFVDYTNDFYETKKYHSNEINLTSKGDGDLTWIVGLYQYHEDYTQALKLANPQQAQLATPCYYVGPPAFCRPAAPNPERNFASQYAALTSDAWAAFAQTTYRFNETFALTAGLRYTKDDKSGYEQQRLVAYSPAGPFGPALGGAYAFDVSSDMDPATPGVQNERRLADDWNAVTGAVNLDWTPDGATLVYGKYSRGYKSGGFLLGSLSPDPRGEEELVDAYEVGLKKTFGGRLVVNAAAFYNDYNGLQLNLSQLNATGTAAASNFINVDARAWGLELETTWQPVRNLQLVLSYGYLNTEITRGCCYFDPADPSALLPSARPSGGAVVSNGVLLRFQDLKGAHLVQSPENKIAANLNYTFDFTAGALTLSTSAFWTDETWYQPFDNPAEHAKAYSITDFRALWRDDQSRYSLIAYVKNAFDQDGVTSAGTSAPAAEFALGSTVVINGVTYQRQSGVTLTHGLVYPRTYGVELQYRF